MNEAVVKTASGKASIQQAVSDSLYGKVLPKDVEITSIAQATAYVQNALQLQSTSDTIVTYYVYFVTPPNGNVYDQYTLLSAQLKNSITAGTFEKSLHTAASGTTLAQASATVAPDFSGLLTFAPVISPTFSPIASTKTASVLNGFTVMGAVQIVIGIVIGTFVLAAGIYCYMHKRSVGHLPGWKPKPKVTQLHHPNVQFPPIYNNNEIDDDFGGVFRHAENEYAGNPYLRSSGNGNGNSSRNITRL